MRRYFIWLLFTLAAISRLNAQITTIPNAGGGGGGTTSSPDHPAWVLCVSAGCNSEVSITFYAIMSTAGVTFDECAVNLATAATGSSVTVDIQDSSGVSIFSTNKLTVTVGNGTTTQFQATFAGGTYTAAKGAKFKAVVTANDSGATAQGAYVSCRVH